MKKLKQKCLICVCAAFLISYLATMCAFTVWEVQNIRSSVSNDFMNAYELLYSQSANDSNFMERADGYLTEAVRKLAQRDIYAAAVIMDAQGEVISQSNLNDIYFGVRLRIANAVDSARLSSCVRDAKAGWSALPQTGESGFSSSGPDGYTQGWILEDDHGNLYAVLLNAKNYEQELVVKAMATRYIITFLVMLAICLLLCRIISRFFMRERVED